MTGLTSLTRSLTDACSEHHQQRSMVMGLCCVVLCIFRSSGARKTAANSVSSFRGYGHAAVEQDIQFTFLLFDLIR